jgi:hypothetical protein
MSHVKLRNNLDKVLSKCSGRIDVHIIDYDNEDQPDIYVCDDISKTEVYTLNNNLTNDLEMQVYCNNKLVYVE